MSSLSQRESLAEQVADLIRGSAALREEIADELADHLASHAEESGIRDPRAAMNEAVEAFGDAKRVARELRAVHMGAEIMFQKIMVVVLLLVVCLMGVGMYFTWSTTREMTAQMAAVTKQTGAQLEELTRRLAETKAGPVDQQLPRLSIRCVDGAKQQAVAGYKVTVKSIDFELRSKEGYALTGGKFLKDYLADAKGEIDSGPLQQGQYELSGGWQVTLDGKAAGSGSWKRTVRLQQMGQVEDVVVEIPTTTKYQMRLQGEVLKYWDAKRMPTVLLRMEGRSAMPNDCSFDWSTYVPIRTAGTSAVTGLMSGERRSLHIDLPHRDGKEGYGMSTLVVSLFELSRDGGPVDIGVSWPEAHLSGSARMDEKGTPARGLPIEVSWGSSVESLLTDDQGRFESQWGCRGMGPANVPYVLRIPWHTPDGSKADFEYLVTVPNSCPIQVDLSKLAVLRVEFVGVEEVEKLLGVARSLRATVSWLKHEKEGEASLINVGGSRMDVMRREISLAPSARADLLVVSGSYEVNIGELMRPMGGGGFSQLGLSGSGTVQASVEAGGVRVLRVDLEKLLGGSPGGVPVPRRAVPGEARKNPAITVVEPATTRGS